MTESEANQNAVRDPSSRATSIVVGAVLSFFVGWFPFLGPIVAGGAAGYLRGQDKLESVLVAVLGSVIASVFFLLFAAFGLVAHAVEGTPGTIVGWVILCLLSLAYFYGFAALGGFIGAAFSSRGSP